MFFGAHVYYVICVIYYACLRMFRVCLEHIIVVQPQGRQKACDLKAMFLYQSSENVFINLTDAKTLTQGTPYYMSHIYIPTYLKVITLFTIF